MAAPNRSRGPRSWTRKLTIEHYRPVTAVGIYVIRSFPGLLGLATRFPGNRSLGERQAELRVPGSPSAGTHRARSGREPPPGTPRAARALLLSGRTRPLRSGGSGPPPA